MFSQKQICVEDGKAQKHDQHSRENVYINPGNLYFGSKKNSMSTDKDCMRDRSNNIDGLDYTQQEIKRKTKRLGGKKMIERKTRRRKGRHRSKPCFQ